MSPGYEPHRRVGRGLITLTLITMSVIVAQPLASVMLPLLLFAVAVMVLIGTLRRR